MKEAKDVLLRSGHYWNYYIQWFCPGPLANGQRPVILRFYRKHVITREVEPYPSRRIISSHPATQQYVRNKVKEQFPVFLQRLLRDFDVTQWSTKYWNYSVAYSFSPEVVKLKFEVEQLWDIMMIDSDSEEAMKVRAQLYKEIEQYDL